MYKRQILGGNDRPPKHQVTPSGQLINGSYRQSVPGSLLIHRGGEKDIIIIIQGKGGGFLVGRV